VFDMDEAKIRGSALSWCRHFHRIDHVTKLKIVILLFDVQSFKVREDLSRLVE
jgi:5S rRNA maturation endonuclease (ribonuclease M5)